MGDVGTANNVHSCAGVHLHTSKVRAPGGGRYKLHPGFSGRWRLHRYGSTWWWRWWTIAWLAQSQWNLCLSKLKGHLPWSFPSTLSWYIWRVCNLNWAYQLRDKYINTFVNNTVALKKKYTKIYKIGNVSAIGPSSYHVVLCIMKKGHWPKRHIFYFKASVITEFAGALSSLLVHHCQRSRSSNKCWRRRFMWLATYFPGNLNGMHHLPGKIGFCINEFSDYNVLKCIGVCVTGHVLLCVSVCGVRTGRELAMNHCHHITVSKWVPNKNVTS